MTKRLIVDTGCPVEIILDERTLERLKLDSDSVSPRYRAQTQQLRVVVRVHGASRDTGVNFDRQLPAHANASVVKIARADGFDGLVGKPFVDHFHFDNDDGREFCLQSWRDYRSPRTR